MSELLDAYNAQMPEKCLSCPVFSAFVLAAESHEKNATELTGQMADSMDGNQLDSREVNDSLAHLRSKLLNMTTDGELSTLRTIATLAEDGYRCPTPKRGGTPGESMPSSIISWLINNKVCRNPALDTLAPQ